MWGRSRRLVLPLAGRVREVLGAVAGFGGEERTAYEELRGEAAAGVCEFADFESFIEGVTCTLDGGDPRVEVGFEGSEVVMLPVGVGGAAEAARGHEMDVHVDEAGQDGLTRGFDGVGIEGFGI